MAVTTDLVTGDREGQTEEETRGGCRAGNLALTK